jgi:translation initiation factor IF-2
MADPNRPNRPIRPRQGAPSSRRKRRVVIEGGGAPGSRPGDRRKAPERPEGRTKGPPAPPPTGPISVESGVSVRDLSQALGVSLPQIIKILMGMGEMKTATQSLSDEEVDLIGAELKREITIKHAADEEEILDDFEDTEADLLPRPPVVTIMGHVDHGKTTLLDAIRQANVVATEAGGITQHIGAYQVEHSGRRITFIDTPGHEAFTAMRARGAKVTDIAVLVVAADDGVMPQTRESISHARAAQVPIVIAVNKIDVPDANPTRVMTQLAEDGLQPEEWGGDTQFSQVSARERENLDDLLERILLVADAELELTANPNARAAGPIIESRLDVGRGPVATMLVQRGTLAVGDAIVAGDAWGKVRALYNYKGEKLKEAKPGDPVEILGFEHPPAAGEQARVVDHERAARDLAEKRGERLRREQLAQRSRRGISLEGLFAEIQEGAVRDLNLVVKADVQGSLEAIAGELAKIQHSEVRVTVIHQGVGGITEGDVMLAAASDALVVGFNVRPNADSRNAADREGVEIRTYRVIYQLTEDIQQALVGMLSPIQREETLGEAQVRATFKVSRLGTIAGCMVTSGTVRRGAQVRIVRDGTVIYETTIAQLKRFKDDVREVAEGFECGILLDSFNDVKEGDVLEVYETREVERTDLDTPVLMLGPGSRARKRAVPPAGTRRSKVPSARTATPPTRRQPVAVARSM